MRDEDSRMPVDGETRDTAADAAAAAANAPAEPGDEPRAPERRGFLMTLISLAALIPSYGLFSLFAARFLYPERPRSGKAKMFVGFTHQLPPGESLEFTSPGGERFLLTNTGAGTNPYLGFSSRCPHLGCRVHWDGGERAFVCPCHGGVFGGDGHATAGPPAKARQSLKACEIVVEGTSLYALVDAT